MAKEAGRRRKLAKWLKGRAHRIFSTSILRKSMMLHDGLLLLTACGTAYCGKIHGPLGHVGFGNPFASGFPIVFGRQRKDRKLHGISKPRSLRPRLREASM